MHVGNLRTALYAYLKAKSCGGTFVLRIEDTDQERYVEGAVGHHLQHPAGDRPDLGRGAPTRTAGYGPYIQSERMGIYMKYAKQLVESGHAYYCFCDKQRLEEMRTIQKASGQAPHYDGHCRNLSAEEVAKNLAEGKPFVIRQKMPREGKTSFEDVVYGHIEVDNAELDDQILIKTDGMPTYNFAKRHRRPPDGDQPCHPRQRVPLLHPEVQPAVRGLRLGEAGLHPLPAGDEGRPEQAVQAQRRRQLSGPRRQGLPDRGDPQLHRPVRLEPQGGAGDSLAARDGRRLPRGGDQQVPRDL